MNILLVTEFFPDQSQVMTGGVEARTYHLANHLKKLGEQVDIVARKRTAVTANIGSLIPRLWFQIDAIIKSKAYRPQVVEGSNFVSYLPAFVIARLKKARAVAWYADVYGKTWFTTMSWPVALIGYVWEWISLKLPWDRVIAMSQSTKKKLIQSGIDRHKIAVVYGGVDKPIIDKLFVKLFDKPTICTAARLVNYKHIDDLIKAVSLVQKDMPQVQLMIAGDGPERHSLELLSKHITHKNSVHFLGSLPQVEVWRLMKQSHVFCLPSTVEGFGLVTIEAIACGLPYVCTDIPATREITQGGKGGYLYEPRNIDQLADCLVKSLTNKPIANTNSLVKNYSWVQISRETLVQYT